jgi:hypothetical protein
MILSGMRSFDALTRLFKKPASLKSVPEAALSFDGLNPLLAKQLSELETQIGQLAQVQFELGQERQRMRIEMEALRKAVGEVPASADASLIPPVSDHDSLQ